MVIVVVCGAAYISGKERITLILMKSFLEQGHEVICITSEWNDGMFIDLLEKNKIPYKKMRIGFVTKTLRWKPILMLLHQLMYLPKLWRDYCSFNNAYSPDITLHTNFHHTFLLYPFLNDRRTHIYHSHESIINSAFYQILFKLFNKKITFFIGVSNFVSKRLVELGLPPKKVKTIYNGLTVYSKHFNKTMSPFVRIGVAGQIGEWKGHEDLIDALGILKNSVQNFRCLIYGKGNEDFISKLNEKIYIYGLMEYVEWRGYVEDQEDLYRDIDIMCVPSRSEEPLATSALEPALYKIPVVASSRGGLPEIVIDGETGFLFPSHCPKLLADKLEILINSPSLRSKMGEEAYTVLKMKFNITSVQLEWEKIFLDKQLDN